MMEIWVPELIPWKKEEEFKNRIMRPQHLKVRGKEFWIEGHERTTPNNTLIFINK